MAFLWFCLAGIVAAFLFDLLRLFRAFIPHHTVAVLFEDILWIAASFLTTFICVIQYAGGVVRWFYLLGFFAAMLLWFLCVSSWLLRFLKALLSGIGFVIKKLLAPFVWIGRKIAKIVRFRTLFEKLFLKNQKKPIAKGNADIV